MRSMSVPIWFASRPSGIRPTGVVAPRHHRKPIDMRTEGRAPTLDEAKAQFEAAWRQWLAGAKLREM